MKNLEPKLTLLARDIKYFFKTDTAQLYLVEVVFSLVVLALVLLLVALFG